MMGFPGSSVVKKLPAKAGDAGLIPDLRRSHMLSSLCSRAGSHKRSAARRSPGIATEKSPCLPQLGKNPMWQRRPNTTKN